MRHINDLHHYQKRGVSFIHKNNRCALFLGLGLGKTVTTLTAISDILDSHSGLKVLVIAPLRVANSVWHTEALNWSHLKHFDVSICTGNEKQRRAALMKTSDVYVINRENTQWLVELYGKKWPFDVVVIDESSSFKSSKSKRFKRLKRVIKYTRYMILLTATPAPNGLGDLWSQIYLIDGGNALGRTMTEYRRRFFERSYCGFKWNLREGSTEKIHKLIQPYVLSMSAADYLEVPKRVDLVETVKLPPKVKRQYDDFERDLFMELDDNLEVEAATAGVLANKLLQFSNGAIYTDEHKNWSELHTAKLDVLAELVEENTEPMLVAYNFKSDLARIKSRFPQAAVLTKEGKMIEEWNNGEIPIMLVHPQSAGHGLNLQHGGSLIVWFSLVWSLEFYQQLVGRVDRQGQTEPVRNIRLVAEGCIDERVLRVLGNNYATQADLLKALRTPTTKTTAPQETEKP